jgi:hypothetical protein
LQKIYGEGGAAWIDTSALDQLRSSPEGSRWLAEHTREGRKAELVNKPYRIIFVQVLPPDYAAGTRPQGDPVLATQANEDSFK